MDDLLELRKVHGSVFVSQLPNGQKIPWQPLSIKDYIEYDKTLRSGIYPPAYIENEIFCKCVLSQTYVDNIDKLRAGIVQQVAQDILIYSGPSAIDELDQVLNIHRNEANQILHQLVSVVCQAFPAYKPEDLYAMDYSTFILRVAQSEEKLLRTGLISEPLSFIDKNQEQANPKAPPPPRNAEELKKQKKANLKAQWQEQQAKKVQNVVPPPAANTQEQVIITKADIIEHQSVMSGHEQDVVRHKQTTDETAAIYGDYLQQIRDGKKLKILTSEERTKVAKEREAIIKQELLQTKNDILKKMAEERKELLKVREKEKERRKKRANRK
jgi:hypothetical protein